MLSIVQINSVNHGSTGSIMINIQEHSIENNFISLVAYPDSRSNRDKSITDKIIIGNRFERNVHNRLAYLSGYHGCFSQFATYQFMKRLDKLKPDIIHLHNLHNNYINFKMFFEYIKKRDIAIVWTLHDCWAFTGHCPHYSAIKCDKWQTECYNCPLYKQYPATRVDKSKEMYNLKRKWFASVKDLTIVTPSEWLKSQVKNSFLSEYPIKVINNGIDLSVFKPTETSFKDKYDIIGKIMLLGVANPWSKKKGLDIFVKLSEMLDSKYIIVLVGLTTDQINLLPDNILGLPRTKNQTKLAEIYSAADYFINPSKEETMGLVTVEALACGIPVIVSNSTAVPEVVNKNCGVIVNKNTAASYFNTIINLEKKFLPSDCINRAKSYDKTIKYQEYMKLYEEIVNIDVQKEDDKNEQDRNFDFPLFK